MQLQFTSMRRRACACKDSRWSKMRCEHEHQSCVGHIQDSLGANKQAQKGTGEKLAS